MALARPTWSSTPHPPAERFAASMATTALLPGSRETHVFPGEAGLTSKPHRDRTTRSRLTWTASPATGIGLPRRPAGRQRGHASLPGATTDPGECHG